MRTKKGTEHFQVPSFEGQEVRVEEWWDKLTGGSWMYAGGNPACMVYRIRSSTNGLPTDDEVVYCKLGNLGHLIHASELEEIG